MLALALYGAGKGLEARGRLVECVYLVIMIPVVILILFAFKGVDIYYLTPFLVSDLRKMILLIVILFFLFSPLEILLFQANHIVTDSKKRVSEAKRAVYSGITVVFIINILLFILNVGNLSINSINIERTSTVKLMKSVKLTGFI